MEIKNRYIIRAVFLTSGQVYYGVRGAGWVCDSHRAAIFSASGAGVRVNSINKNLNWKAERVPVYIKVLDDEN